MLSHKYLPLKYYIGVSICLKLQLSSKKIWAFKNHQEQASRWTYTAVKSYLLIAINIKIVLLNINRFNLCSEQLERHILGSVCFSVNIYHYSHRNAVDYVRKITKVCINFKREKIQMFQSQKTFWTVQDQNLPNLLCNVYSFCANGRLPSTFAASYRLLAARPLQRKEIVLPLLLTEFF